MSFRGRVRKTDVASAAVAPAGCSAMAGENPDCVTSTGSVMYVLGLTCTGAPDAGISQICTVLGVTVLAVVRSALRARIIPVVENPSTAANPAAAAFGLPFESRQGACAFSGPRGEVTGANRVRLP